MPESRLSLEDLENRGEFIHRHIAPDDADIASMLGAIGLNSLDNLVEKAIPSSITSNTKLNLAAPRTEQQALADLGSFAARNQVFKSMLGMGYSDCHIPTVILRNILENPGWYTAYTPYQPEISQGRMEALLNFQTMIMDLNGMEIANASLLDEGTAAAEAMTMVMNASNNKGRKFFISKDCHPQTIEVVCTRAEPQDIEVVVGDHREGALAEDVFGVLLQYPATGGEIFDYADFAARAHETDALVVVAADILALTLLKPPGEFGADVVVGNSQRFGVPLGFGGPHAAYLATKERYKRAMPGRIVGVSIDADGKPALRLSLQTREQHIRRERATSNICTAQVLLAVIASMYGVYHGPKGVKRIAQRTHRLACALADGLERMGYALTADSFFDTVAVRVGESGAARIIEKAAAREMNLRAIDDDTVGIALDETSRREEVEALWGVFAEGGSAGISFDDVEANSADRIPDSLRRTSPYMTHPVFNSCHAEHEMLRYIYRLQEKDIALTRSMIPLGSCTMKLNATTEMIPVTWAEFGGVHPFAPEEQVRGYRDFIADLENMLAECTGFDSISMQPNSGAQGEYAGLLVIRKYHASNNEGYRNICLIPSSAHGTNPATAVMAGFEVVVVDCDSDGNVNIADLREKAGKFSEKLAALMITYPSTHGVFEEGIVEICEVIHQNGGQVYMDGANLNALVGICKPGEFGPDVSHMNLHKTFCIPHGGGGPGMGPIGVVRHLSPYLPKHSVVSGVGPETGVDAISSAPWGSAGILPISWMYIAMMGREGLVKATQVAILNANYVARRLDPHYEVLYKGTNGMVAHECIIDIRPLQETSGVTNEDIAKRLMDYGFHAPTMSFPVSGTLMIEPTESESREEMDRFCDAMIDIRRDIQEIADGLMSAEDNALKNAPHTASDIAADEWTHPYSREKAVFPLPWVRATKYWPPVKRVNNPYGDRNLVCSCLPVENYA